MPDPSSPRLLVLGASAGGIEALGAVLADLPPDLGACVLVVQHLSQNSHGHLPRVLGRRGSLPVRFARDGDAYEPGQVLIAPPDQHLFAEADRVAVVHGPRVNRVRPAIDLAMRSAAANHGNRVVAALLSGLMDDGVAGLLAVQRCGGLTFVQSPRDALFPDMPQAALDLLTPSGTYAASDLGAVLASAVGAPLPEAVAIPEAIRKEAMLESRANGDISLSEALGDQIPVSCPDCGGPLWKLHADGPQRYRCHIGHSYTQRLLLDSQRDSIEQSMWVAMRMLEERARMLDGLGAGTTHSQPYDERAAEARGHADRIRRFLEEIGGRGDGAPIPTDSVTPKPVSSVVQTAIPGGAGATSG